MRPDERFRLNEAAKEHRLNKLQRRLAGATPRTKKSQKAPARWGWWLFWLIVAGVIWWLRKKAKGG